MKVCTNCGIEKPESEFGKRKRNKDGLDSWCKSCYSLKTRLYHKKNKEKVKQKHKEYNDKHKEENKKWKKDHYEKNKEKIKQRTKEYCENNKEKVKQYNKDYYEDNKEEIRQKHKEYVEKNKEKLNQWRRDYENNRIKNEPLFKMMKNLRRRTSLALNGKSKSKSTIELLGCTPEYLKEHLENKFQSGMTFENYGEWHIDHIIPLSSANTIQELYDLCYYKNLQPLWAIDNLRKGSKIEKE